MKRAEDILKKRLNSKNYQKLVTLNNPSLNDFVAEYIELLNPDKVFVGTDSEDDLDYIRKSAINNGEEKELNIEGHTIHFDGYYDQARDKANTKYLAPEGVSLGRHINSIDRDKGLNELHEILKGIMKGHELYIKFVCLAPIKSEFSIPCVQLTDSAYVAHSEDLLYRQGYSEFKSRGNSRDFFRFVHSEGELNNGVSVNIDKRRIYIDLKENTVFSTNTQYGGNTIGLKKLAMRLAIKKASQEGWLTEHMFVMGINGPGGRISYFTGAFPSLCGKTSTSMVLGERVVGDDIAYLRKRNGKVYGVNVENGIFGIIMGVNAKDDALIWDALHSKGEIIFSNVLVTQDRKVYWIGKDNDPPNEGVNHSGTWYAGKKDRDGKAIDISSRNARFTLDIRLLKNRDPDINKPEGVRIRGIIYGGRDSDTWVPVEESFSWEHGMIAKGAALESETTAATLGKEGIRKFNPMSNLDFLSIPIAEYLQRNLDFGKSIEEPPRIFAVNYFLKDGDGNWLNDREDKRVWLKWMDLRVHDEVGAIKTPTGLIPEYSDLKRLFKDVLNEEYTENMYIKQFTIRIPEKISKIDRIVKIYKNDVADTPKKVFEVLNLQKKRLLEAKEAYGDYVSPFDVD